MPTLIVANKLYSSWSLRPWLLMRQLGIDFDEIVIPLDHANTQVRIREHSPAGKVPVLKDGEITVWDSLAIVEYVAERWPEAGVWPLDREARAHARSISAEMHSGFAALRSACPMNLGKHFAEGDRGEKVARDASRIEAVWREARTGSAEMARSSSVPSRPPTRCMRRSRPASTPMASRSRRKAAPIWMPSWDYRALLNGAKLR